MQRDQAPRNGPNTRDGNHLRAPVRLHPEEETSPRPHAQGPVASADAAEQQGVRRGRSALEDTLGQWLNDNVQANERMRLGQLRDVRDELSLVYSAWQHEYSNRVENQQAVMNARAEVDRLSRILDNIQRMVPEALPYLRDPDETESEIDSDDEEILWWAPRAPEIIDLTGDSSDEEME